MRNKQVYNVFIDFETYCDLDINKVGAFKYVDHPSCRIIYMSYATGSEEAQLWSPDQLFPKELLGLDDSTFIYALNATFDYLIWNIVGRRDYPEYFSNLALSQVVDVMALLARYKLPQSLAKAALELNRDNTKLAAGKRLMRKFSVPGPQCIDTRKINLRAELSIDPPCNMRQIDDVRAMIKSRESSVENTRTVFSENESEKKELRISLAKYKAERLQRYAELSDYVTYGEYCIEDTEATREIVYNLPADRLSDPEQKLWELTFRMNERGLPVDKEEINAIIIYLADYTEEMKKKLPIITDGFVQTPGQIQKIKEFCGMHGIQLDNLAKETVDKTLDRKDLPDEVREVLKIRRLLGKSSVTKFIKMAEMELDGYIHDNYIYHKAGTGRWAGTGFQMHNMPRKKHKDPEKWIEKFLWGEHMDDPVNIAKGLIRPMIKAPEGYMLIVSDYSSIENRTSPWYAFDDDALDVFRRNENEYIQMAAYLYSVSPEEIVKGSTEYLIGKQTVIGCQYQMGENRLYQTCQSYGIDITRSRSHKAVVTYRAVRPKMVKMWRNFGQATLLAVLNPGKPFETNRCMFRAAKDRNKDFWLVINIATGRNLFYRSPEAEDGMYGPVVSYSGYSATRHRMERQYLSPGLITENIVQATARDILATGKLNIEKFMPEVALSISVHDEAGGLIREPDIHDNTLDRFNDLLCTQDAWAAGLPLAAEGYISNRYRKD